MVTQPLMYKSIHQHPTPRQIYGAKLAGEGTLSEADAEDMVRTYRGALDAGYHTNKTILSNYKPPFEVDWKPYIGTQWNEKDDTRLPLDVLKQLGRKIAEVPPNFKLHPRVEKIMADRRLMAEGKLPLDWGWRKISRTRPCSAKATRCAFPGRM
jgi:2-oxoglutarate dehydrogenase E1 component